MHLATWQGRLQSAHFTRPKPQTSLFSNSQSSWNGTKHKWMRMPLSCRSPGAKRMRNVVGRFITASCHESAIVVVMSKFTTSKVTVITIPIMNVATQQVSITIFARHAKIKAFMLPESWSKLPWICKKPRYWQKTIKGLWKETKSEWSLASSSHAQRLWFMLLVIIMERQSRRHVLVMRFLQIFRQEGCSRGGIVCLRFKYISNCCQRKCRLNTHVKVAG